MLSAPVAKIAAIVPRGELFALGASTAGILTALVLLGGESASPETPLQEVSALARGVGWTAGQQWAAAGHAWLSDPARAYPIASSCFLLTWFVVAMTHVRLDGQRPRHAIPLALYGVAVLVEAGADHTTAWTALGLGIAGSVVPEFNRAFPLRSVLGAAARTSADLLAMTLYLPIRLWCLLWQRPAVNRSRRQDNTPGEPAQAESSELFTVPDDRQ